MNIDRLMISWGRKGGLSIGLYGWSVVRSRSPLLARVASGVKDKIDWIGDENDLTRQAAGGVGGNRMESGPS